MSPPAAPDGRGSFVARLLRIAARSLDAPEAALELHERGARGAVVCLGRDAPTPAMTAFHERVRAAHATVVEGGERPDGGLAALGSPLIGPGGVEVGVVSVFAPSPRTWSPDDVGILEHVAWMPESGFEKVGGRAGAAARQEAEDRYRVLVETSTDAIALHTNGVLVFANRATARLLGAPDVSGLVGSPIDRFLAPPYLPAVRRALLEPHAVIPAVLEIVARRLDGNFVDVELSAIPLVFRGRPSVQVVMRDITDRVRARDALEANEARFRSLVRQLPFVLWTTDRDGRITTVIGDASSPYGSRAAAALYQGSGLPLPPDEPVAPDDADDGIAGTEVTVEGRLYAQRVDVLRDERGESTGTIGLAFDTTPWGRLHELIQDAARLDDVGRLAGGVAHEINNVLAIIGGYAALLAQEGAPEVAAKAAGILGATRRGSDITNDLLTFAMRDVHRPTRLSPRALARDLAGALRGRSPANVEVVLQEDPDVAEITGDPAQLSHALLNVGLNAIEAMPQGGRVTIRVSNVRRRSTDPRDARVRIRVADTGAGMTADVRKRMFHPFFTAAKGGGHVGLGLSMARGAIKQHGGEIRIASEAGVGTTVTIDLPASPPAEVPPPRQQPPHPDVSGRRRVLVVDDEPDLRTITSALLARMGFAATEAADGETALALYQASPGAFAVVLLDVVMPGMSGIEVLERLVDLDPDVRVVVVTGYPKGDLDERVFHLGRVGYLGKPFSVKALREAIRAVTAADAPAPGA